MKHRLRFSVTALAASAMLCGTQLPAVIANSLDHFAFAPIANPQTSTVPFAVSIMAQDVTNALVTGFVGTVTLSATGNGGSESMMPTSSGTFSGGIWTGNVTIAAIDLNVVLQASDGSGHTGSSNPFNVVSSSHPDSFYILNLPTTDLTSDPTAARLYVSIPNNAGGSLSNSVVAIDPTTGLAGSPVYVGGTPSILAVSDNGQYLYVGLAETNAVARLSLPSMASDLSFPLSNIATDLKVMPGSPGSIAIALVSGCCPSYSQGVAIYDNGIPRPIMLGSDFDDPDALTFGGTNAVLYGHGNGTTDYPFVMMSVTASGVVAITSALNLPNGSCDMAYGGGLVFTSTGAIIQPTNLVQVGTLGGSGPVLPDFVEDRVFLLNGSTLQVYEANTLLQLGAITMTGMSGFGGSLVRWGADGLAFLTSGGQVFVVRTSFIPSGPSADIAVAASVLPSPGLQGIGMTNTLTVTNGGPNSAGNVMLSDKLPPGATLASVTVSQGTFIQSNGVVTCNLGTLAIGATATATLVVVPPIGAALTNVLTNVVVVTSTAADPNYTNNSTSVVTTALLDANGDGLPDWWQIRYFGSATNLVAAPGVDPDSDGATNLKEYLAGTDPTNNLSFPINWPVLAFSNVLSGVPNPTQVTHAGDGSGRLFICEQQGLIVIPTTNRLHQTILTTFLSIGSRINRSYIEQGLLSLAFPPGYATNGHFYVSYTDFSNSVVVSRFLVTTNANTADPNSEQKILVVRKPYQNHNGGQLAFGPDGYLYVGIGDGGSEGDPNNNGQTTTNLLGKVLRIDTEGATQPYGIPPNNPFVGNPAYRPEIWAFGLRNPWRFSFDRQTGDLYIGDVGQDTYEEIDMQRAGDPGGENYGWRLFEGDYPYNPPSGTNTNGLTWPVADYSHAYGCAVIGGGVYRNSVYPRMYGMYFFGDFCNGPIWGLSNQNGTWYTNLLSTLNDDISSFGEDDAGNLYVARYYSGSISQIQDPSATLLPTFLPGSGTYNSEQTVIISGVVSTAAIHFTTNGVDPTVNDPTITSGGSVYINTSLTLKAKAFMTGFNPGPVTAANYTLKVGTPTFNPSTSLILAGAQVSISTVTTGATIYYTLDGTTPGTNSLVYSAPVTITTNATLEAIGAKQGFVNSAVQSMNYTAGYMINTSSSPPSGGTTSGGGLLAFGSNATICAVTNACYSFVNWTDPNSNVLSTSSCYSFTVTTNETFVANFAPPVGAYNINTSSLPPAGGSTSGGGMAVCGSNVTVCATPDAPCYNFVYWTDQNNLVVSLSPCFTFTAGADANLTAHFALITSFTISTTNLPNGGGLTTGGGVVACDSNVTVCAIANACYSFVNWMDQDSNVVSTSACYSFAVVGNETLTANFAMNGVPTGGSLTSLWSFAGGLDGANPEAALAQGSDGNFYGTTYGSGSGPSAYGTVFRISTNGILTTLWSFTNGADGANPGSGLVQGNNGSFYGTTYGSGSGSSGYGTVFRISTNGVLATLWVFTNGVDGAYSYATLVQGADGNFYGTTSGSGTGPSGNGNVFRITPAGSLSNLHPFVVSDGANPSAGLVQGSDGNFYGTTYTGGNGYGTVFRISSSGSLTTLWTFTNGLDGASSYAVLVQDSGGNIYGTASQGGTGNGTVFRISPAGNLTNLWEFDNCSDGAHPFAGLVQGSDGNFYGTTSGSGSGPSSYGMVFRISPSGNLTTLHSFGFGDGANSYATLVQGSDGKFYGTTYAGGVSGEGIVFQLSVPLNPPANQISAIQLAGSNIIVTIPSVARETYQLQYADSLTLSNWSNVGTASLTNSIGGLLSLTNFGGALQPHGFYRFDITP